MSHPTDWKRYAVPQRRPQSGCIPAGFEMLVRAAGLVDVDLESFQDDFDLDKARGPADPPRNNFESVAAAVVFRYPHVVFRRHVFSKGMDKVAFIESCLAAKRPALVSVSLQGLNSISETQWGFGWHIMLAVGLENGDVRLLHSILPDGRALTIVLSKSDLAYIHDTFPGGDDVAVLELPSEP